MPQDEMNLSDATRALLHHTELNKSGRWIAALSRLVLSAVHDSAVTNQRDDLREHLRGLGVDVPSDAFDATVDSCIDRGELVAAGNGMLTLSADVAESIDNQVDESRQQREHRETIFKEITSRRCPGLPGSATWLKFQMSFLVPLLRRLGASVYELLETADWQDVDYGDLYHDFLGNHHPNAQRALRETVRDFFSEDTGTARSFVLKLLSAHYVLEACSLPAPTLQRLAGLAERPSGLTAYVDTNFVFSLLRLHINPANEVAQPLLQLVKET